MSIRRRSTVHDLASLRLHPDGSRVQATAPSGSKIKSSAVNTTTQATRLASNTALNTKAEWVALDAGGTASIKQRRRTQPVIVKKTDRKGKGRAEESAEQDEIGQSADSLQRREDSLPPGEEAIQSDSEDSVKDPRAKKRRKFYHDFSFLDVPINAPGLPNHAQASSFGAVNTHQHTGGIELLDSQPFLPVPSSDLLKCIHYFASEYYTSRNCLFDAPKQARIARKARKAEKMTLGASKKRSQREDEFERDPEDEDSDSVVVEPKAARTRAPKVIKGEPRRDMYKAFEGSALLAIGMLLQEHVMGMMSNEPPEDWLRQMEAREALEASGIRGTRKRRKWKVEDDEVTADSTSASDNDDFSSENSSSHVSSKNDE